MQATAEASIFFVKTRSFQYRVDELPEAQVASAGCSGWRRSRPCRSWRSISEGWSTGWRSLGTPAVNVIKRLVS